MKKISLYLYLVFVLILSYSTYGQTVKFVTDIKAGSTTTADTDLTFNIYSSDTLYHATGSHLTDPNVTVANDTVTIVNVAVLGGNTYNFKIASVDEQDQESSLSNAIQLIVPLNEITITTTSTSAAWTPTEIINTGSTLIWEVTGAVTIANQTIDVPIFDLSGSGGATSTITIKSVTSFIGLEKLKIPELNVTSVDLSAASELTVFKGNDNQLTAFDVDDRPSLKWLYLHHNALDMDELDEIINDLAKYNLTGGNIEIANQSPVANLSSNAYLGWLTLDANLWNIDVAVPDPPYEPPPPGDDDGLMPVISNFNIPNANPNRVEFDASEIVTATTVGNFKIEGKTISNITIDGDGLGGFFTLSANLTFWDNILIRYEGGSNIQDSENNPLRNFTLHYILNNINEPTADTIRYAASTTQGSGNGLDEANAWSYTDAGLNATSGMTVMMLAGQSSSNIVISNNGTATDPIKFIGYNNAGKDVNRTRSVGMSFDNTIMPLFSSVSSANTIAAEKNYIIIRSVQIFDFDKVGISVNDSHSHIIDNVYIDGNAYANTNGESCIWSNRQYDQGNNRIINSYLANAQDHGYKMAAVSNLIYNTWGVSSRDASMDYYFLNDGALPGVGHSTAIINCYINRYADDSHSGHGISLKSDQHLNGWVIEHTLVENCEIINTKMQFRHRPTKYNIARNIILTGQYAIGDNNVGINLNDGCSYNICENFRMTDVEWFLQFYETVENGGDQENPHHNKFINCTVDGSKLLFRTGTYQATQANTIVDNEIINCTFNNIANIYNDSSIDIQSSNLITNSIFTNSPDLGSGNLNVVFSYSNFYNSFSKPTGTGNISTNPYFTNTSIGDFTLTLSTPTTVSEGGQTIQPPFYDKSGNERIAPYSMGAFNK